MMTRRNVLKTLGGVTALAARSQLWAADRLAWEKPMGLEIYTVRDLFAKDPAGTLKQVATVGYKEVEIVPGIKPALLNSYLRAAGLTAPSGYVGAPKSVEDWKKTIDASRDYELHYLVIGDNPRLDIEAWKRRADLYNQCGKLAQDAGMQFCYHAHYNEFARVDNTSGYDIMLTRCEPKLLKMEMDIFWATYAGVDPVHYFRLHRGRFPLLHIKDLYKNVAVNPHEDPPANGPNPFAPVGQGKIDWPRIFAQVDEAGVKHIFVEQDVCNMPPLEAIKISFDYLKNLRSS
ncbi:MAG TPA: sugar phosphate isomerase/epimerase [Terriglobia bacterium]|nr:sugar phosphate isomerase/epimerase [Terriglobia bacterium]